MLMRRGGGRPVVAELGRELVATSGGWIAPAACSAPVATAAADGPMPIDDMAIDDGADGGGGGGGGNDGIGGNLRIIIMPTRTQPTPASSRPQLWQRHRPPLPLA